MLVLPARQGAAVCPRVSQRGREQRYVLVLPARQGAAVRPIASPSATGSSGACWFSQRGREQWYVPESPRERERDVMKYRKCVFRLKLSSITTKSVQRVQRKQESAPHDGLQRL